MGCALILDIIKSPFGNTKDTLMNIKESPQQEHKTISYKFRLYPSKEQIDLLTNNFGCARALYNTCIYINRKMYDDYQKGNAPKRFFSKFDMINHLRTLHGTEDYPWIKDFASDIKDAVVTNADRAYQNFFKGKGAIGYPKFKKKHADRQTFAFGVRKTANVVHGNLLTVPKVGRVKLKIHRPIEGIIKQVTIEYKAGEYHAIIVTKQPMPKRMSMADAKKNAIGVDLGVRKLATLSDGVVFENKRVLANYEEKLANAQRSLSKKQIGSIARDRAKKKVNKIYLKITRVRSWLLHQVSRYIVDNFSLIAIEDLSVKSMMKNKYIAKIVSDASMAELAQQIAYKAMWLGKRVVQVSRWFPSSKRCSKCSVVNKGLENQETWTCKCCNTKHNRDSNAAVNIINEVLKELKNLGNRDVVLPTK